MRVVVLVVICDALRGAESRKRERWKARVDVTVAVTVLIGWRINGLFCSRFPSSSLCLESIPCPSFKLLVLLSYTVFL
jgi:hypothetical protein